VWKSFAKIDPGTSKNRWTEKIKKITRPKHNSLSLSRAIIKRRYHDVVHTHHHREFVEGLWRSFALSLSLSPIVAQTLEEPYMHGIVWDGDVVDEIIVKRACKLFNVISMYIIVVEFIQLCGRKTK